MKQVILTDKATESLRRHINSNYEDGLYTKSSSWVETLYEAIKPVRETNILIEHIPSLKLPEETGEKSKYDLENSITFFSAYQNLTHHQATSESFWAYMTHVQYWEYTMQRWPVANKKERQSEFIKERYFLNAGTDRALGRNSIARLWWYAKLTYEEASETPFRLTKILLSQLDIAQNLLERSWGKNNSILRSCLEFIADNPELMKGANRDKTRFLIKSLTLEGGVCIIDMLSPDDIKKFLKGRYDAWDKRTSAKTQPIA